MLVWPPKDLPESRSSSRLTAMRAFDDSRFLERCFGDSANASCALVVHVPRLNASNAAELFIPGSFPLCNKAAQPEKAESVRPVSMIADKIRSQKASVCQATHFASAYRSFNSQSYSSLLIASLL